MRNIVFSNGEFYHVYNRGTDKRAVFSDESDLNRFMQSMEEFNTVEPIGSIFENSFSKKHQLGNPTSKLWQGGVNEEKLVNFVAFCLNPNHYHFILEQLVDGGVSMFMKRLGGGYTKYFNEKHKRSGVLFQGKYKAVHVDSNEYLLHSSVYVNLNDRVHQLGNPTSKLVKSRSSWEEYIGESKNNFCSKDIILEQYKNIGEYKKFALSSLEDILKRRAANRDNTDVFAEEL
ncbi:MAG: transposase [Candidatus Yonathbacteria bacterium]|nr:transposase [Candidatus Yonathbacteria bacterium]